MKVIRLNNGITLIPENEFEEDCLRSIVRSDVKIQHDDPWERTGNVSLTYDDSWGR